MSGTLEMKEMCAAPGGNRRPDSRAVVSQHIPEQLPRTKGPGAGEAPTTAGRAASQLLQMKKSWSSWVTHSPQPYIRLDMRFLEGREGGGAQLPVLVPNSGVGFWESCK